MAENAYTPEYLPCPLHAAAQRRPAAPALVVPSGALSYEKLDGLVSAAAARLRGHGIGAGDFAGLYLPNDHRHVVLVMALLRCGAVACPLSLRTPPAALRPLLARIRSRWLIAENSPSGFEARGGVRVLDPRDILSGEPEPAVEMPRYAARQPATVVFTSGSTGAPRAALHPFGALYYSAAGFNGWASVGPGDRWLLSLPLYHVSGLGIVFRCLLAGAAIVIPPAGASLSEAVARYRITRLSLVATQLDRMIREGGLEALDSLRTLLLGGSTVPSALIREAHRLGLPVCPSYGLTEMSSTVAVARPAEAAADPSASGRVLPHREVGIAPDGEVRVRGRTLFAGYVDGERLERPFDAEGWYPTGDLGLMDRDGCLHLLGRKDNLFISGGENIQPEEVERALCRLPGVAQAVVVPVSDDEYGQRPVAFVQVEGSGMEPRGWAEALEHTLPRFKVPVAFHPWPQEAAQGLKVSRAVLTELADRLRMEPQ